MSSYIWLRPLKCLEDMSCYEATQKLTNDEREALLFENVANGNIVSQLNNVEVSKAHIGLFLKAYSDAYSNADQHGPYTLPPDLYLRHSDVTHAFDNGPKIKKRSGRPNRTNEMQRRDAHLAIQMHLLIQGGEADNATQAARLLINSQSPFIRVKGASYESSHRAALRAYDGYFEDL